MKRTLLLSLSFAYSLVLFSQEMVPGGAQQDPPADPFKKEIPNKMDVFVGTVFPNWVGAKPIFEGGKSSVPVNFGYDYRISPRFTLGLHITHGKAESPDIRYYDRFTNNVLFTYKYRMNFTIFQSRLNYAWLIRDKFYVYSGLSLGYVHENVSLTNPIAANEPNRQYYYSGVYADGLAVQVCLLGTKMMLGKRIGINSEFGVGLEGFVKLGLLYRVR